jgi:hypothetical protein
MNQVVTLWRFEDFLRNRLRCGIENHRTINMIEATCSLALTDERRYCPRAIEEFL